MSAGTLADRAAIQDLLLRYALAVDGGDFDAVGECFTPGARAFYSGVQLEPGVGPIVEHVSGVRHYVQCQHVFGPALIDVTGDRATAVSYATAYLVQAGPDGHVAMTRGLRYDDELVRTPSGWRIDARVHQAMWSADVPVTWPVPPSR